MIPRIPTGDNCQSLHLTLRSHLPSNSFLSLTEFDISPTTLTQYVKEGFNIPATLDSASLKRKIEFLAGRKCAQRALTESGLVTKGCLPISAHRFPVWPAKRTGSITHSNNTAAALVAATQDYISVGIDIEEWIDEKRAEIISKKICRQDELLLRNKLEIPSISLWCTLAFSIKESLFKALFTLVGIPFGFHSASIRMIDIHEGICVLQLTTTLSKKYCEGFEVTARFIYNQSHIVSFILLRHD